MSGVTTAGMIGGAMLGGYALSSLTAKMPSYPTPHAPDAPKLANAVSPNRGMLSGQGQAGSGQGSGAPGPGQTMLTGTGGVDPNALNLNKTTLLGG